MPNLPDETVRKIRTEAKHWPHRVLSKRWSMSLRAVSDLVNRISYANVA